jgi:hypothetical protein
VRVFGYQHTTITTWFTCTGAYSATLQGRIFRNLTLPHLQLDELRTRLRSRAHTLWLIYGQIKKTYRHRKLVRVRHVMRCGASVDE